MPTSSRAGDCPVLTNETPGYLCLALGASSEEMGWGACHVLLPSLPGAHFLPPRHGSNPFSYRVDLLTHVSVFLSQEMPDKQAPRDPGDQQGSLKVQEAQGTE